RQWDVDRASGGGDGDIRELTANRAGGLGVIGMLVCQRDSCEPSSTIGHLHERFDVVMERRTRIDQPGRVTTHNPGVRARQRERAWVRRADPDDVVPWDVDPGHLGRVATVAYAGLLALDRTRAAALLEPPADDPLRVDPD